MADRLVVDRKFELRNKVREALESESLTKENKDAVFISGLISGLWEFIEANEPVVEEIHNNPEVSAAGFTIAQSQGELSESILNTIDDGIISFSLPDFKPLFISKTFFSIFNLVPGEFPENIELLTRFCLKEDKQALINFINQLKNRNQDELEYRIVFPDKQVKWIQIKARVVSEQSGKAIRADLSLSDISDKKLYQQYTVRFSQTLLNLGLDFSENINSLTSLFGELFGATCALYNRMEEGMLCSIGQWATPPDFNAKDKPEGHICYDVIKNSSNKILLVRNLPETIYAETDPNVRPYNLKTYVGRAVFCDGEAVGSVCAVYQADFSPGIEHETLLNMIANAIGVEEVRRKAARILKESEEKLKILINATPDIICFKDAEGRWLQANDGILKVYELENVDYVGKTDKELSSFTASIYKDGFRQCSDTDEQAWLSGQLSRVEEIIPDRNGNEHIYDVIKVPVYNADSSRKGMVVFGRDITYRIEAEKQTRFLNQCALEFLELDDNANIYEYIGEKVHQLAGKSYIMVTSFDETNQMATLQSVHGVGKIMDSVLKILGQHPVGMTSYLTPARKKDVLYQKLTNRENLYEMLSGAISKPVSMLLESILDIGRIYEMGFARRDFLIGDVTIITPKNKPLENVEVIEAFIKVAAVALHRRQVKDALTNSEESYMGLFNSITSSVYIMNKDGRFADVNDGAVAMYGYPRERFIGNTPEFLSAPGKNETVDIAALQRKTMAGAPQVFEFWGLRSNGEVFPKEVRFYKGKHLGEDAVIVIANDITEQYNIFSQLVEAKEKAEESDRLKTSFLHNISHEIRTPMNGIVGFSALLTQPGIPQNDVLEYHSIINSCSNQLLSIISDIVNIATLEAGQEKVREAPVNLNEMMHVIYYQLVSKATEKNLRLSYSTNLRENQVLVNSDETKLNQILTNLINNAIKFTEKGGIHISFMLEDQFLQFCVEDTGIGIPEEMQGIIFDRFRQVSTATSRNSGGTGLGLSISKSYVELLGGKIWLESNSLDGTKFYFTIPYKPSGILTSEGLPEVLNSAIPSFDHKTILIVEDELINYKLLVKMLQQFNFNILWAENGEDAIKTCAVKTEIDLVLMDLKIPGIDGFEASSQIKKRRPDLPIIAQSALALAGDRINALNAGCDDYISKPIRKDLLISKLNKYLG